MRRVTVLFALVTAALLLKLDINVAWGVLDEAYGFGTAREVFHDLQAVLCAVGMILAYVAAGPDLRRRLRFSLWMLGLLLGQTLMDVAWAMGDAEDRIGGFRISAYVTLVLTSCVAGAAVLAILLQTARDVEKRP